MAELVIDIPDETARALRVEPPKLAAEVRLAAAIKLYEIGRLSGGSAAELAGIPKPLFMERLAAYGVPAIHYDPLALREDFDNA